MSKCDKSQMFGMQTKIDCIHFIWNGCKGKLILYLTLTKCAFSLFLKCTRSIHISCNTLLFNYSQFLVKWHTIYMYVGNCFKIFHPHSVLCSSWRTRTFPVALSHISQFCVYQLGSAAQRRRDRQINIVVCLWYQEQKLADPCVIGKISTSCDWYRTELDIQVCVACPGFWRLDVVLTIELDTAPLHLFLLAKYGDASVK